MFHPADGDAGFALHDFGALEMLNDRVPATYRLSEDGTRELMRGDGQASATQTHEGNAGASFGLKPQVGAHSVRRVRRRVEASIRRLGLRFVEGPPRNDDGTVTWPGTGDKPGTDRYWDPYIGRLENPDRDFRVHVEMDPSRDEATGRVEELYERCEEEDRDDPESPECKPHLRVQVVPGVRDQPRYERDNRIFVQDLVTNEPAPDDHVIPGDPHRNRQEAAIIVSEPLPLARLLVSDGVRVRFTGQPETAYTANRVVGSLSRVCTPPFPATLDQRFGAVSAMEGTAIHPGAYKMRAALLAQSQISAHDRLDVTECRTPTDPTQVTGVEAPMLTSRGLRRFAQSITTPVRIGMAIEFDAIGSGTEEHAIRGLCQTLGHKFPSKTAAEHMVLARRVYPLVIEELERFWGQLGIGVSVFQRGATVPFPRVQARMNYETLVPAMPREIPAVVPATCGSGFDLRERVIGQTVKGTSGPERNVFTDVCVQADRYMFFNSNVFSALYAGPCPTSETATGCVVSCRARVPSITSTTALDETPRRSPAREIARALAVTLAHEVGHALGLDHLVGYEDNQRTWSEAAGRDVSQRDAFSTVTRNALLPDCTEPFLGTRRDTGNPGGPLGDVSTFLMSPGTTKSDSCSDVGGTFNHPWMLDRVDVLPQVRLDDGSATIRGRQALSSSCSMFGRWPVGGTHATAPNSLRYLRSQFPR